ncbi:glucose-6-phosphate isomerase, partial [Kibdelosporangium lantanae]
MTEISVEIVDTKLADEAASLVETLVADQVASKITAQDPTLWGPDAESESAIRLSWVT